MVVLRTRAFVSESNEREPNKRVHIKQESLDSNILESMLFKVLRMECLLTYRAVEKKMGGRFNTRTTTTEWI